MNQDGADAAPVSPFDGISKQELLLELRRRMRVAPKIILKRKPKLVKTVEFVLRSFLQREARLTLDRFPREHFCTQQVILVGIFVLYGLQRERITFLDVREDLGNLTFLLDFLRSYYPRDKNYMQSYLRKYLAILEELCVILERASQVIRTNWTAVKEAFQQVESQPPLVLNEYTVPLVADIHPLKLLGAGGFGAIYKVSLGGTIIAGKLIPLERMQRPKYACVDKMVASMINSPFLVRYYSCFATNLAYVTLMEYIKGVDLNRLIKHSEPLDAITVSLVLAQLGLAVQYLHFRGFIHRDIKPANVMVFPGCRIRVIDLDTCKVCTSLYGDGYTRSFRHRTFGEFRDSEVAGTLVFFAPETIERRSYGRATDWWAIGVTAYCMGVRKLPFRGKDEDVRRKICSADYEIPHEHPELAGLIARLVQREPRRRITSARFEEYQNEPIFAGIQWENLDVDWLYEIKQLADLMAMNEDGCLSPKQMSEKKPRKNKKPRPQLKFSDVDDVTKHEKLYTYFTDSFYAFLVARSKDPNGNATLDIAEEFDYIPEFTERRRRATYRFQSVRTEALLKTGTTGCWMPSLVSHIPLLDSSAGDNRSIDFQMFPKLNVHVVQSLDFELLGTQSVSGSSIRGGSDISGGAGGKLAS